MKKTLLLLSAFLMVASVASAQRGSLTLGFDDCRLAGGSSSKFFACNTNSATAANTRNAVGAYVAGTNVNDLIAWSGFVDVFLADLTVAPWWQHGAAPACRGSDDLSVQFGGGFSCFDYQAQVPNGALGGQQYDYPAFQTNHTKIRFVAAVSASEIHPPLTPGEETYLLNVLIRNGNTVAPNAICAGCAIPAVLSFTHLDIEQGNLDNFSVVYRSPTPADAGAPLAPAEAVATWQTDTVFSDPTPTNNKSWGAIKSTYR